MKIKLLYLSLYSLIRRRYKTNILTKKQIYCELGRHFLIPHPVKKYVLKELEKMKLIKINKNKIIIIKYKGLDIKSIHLNTLKY